MSQKSVQKYYFTAAAKSSLLEAMNTGAYFEYRFGDIVETRIFDHPVGALSRRLELSISPSSSVDDYLILAIDTDPYAQHIVYGGEPSELVIQSAIKLEDLTMIPDGIGGSRFVTQTGKIRRYLSLFSQEV